MNRTLLVFIRKPIEGRVKTRLAKDVGEAKALEIYRWLIQLTEKSFAKLIAEVKIYFDTDQGDLPEYLNGYSNRIQSGGDLGARIKLAFMDHLSKDESKKVVLIGSDCPEISQKILEQAFDALKVHDVVFGPANDGGIYLIGLNKHQTAMFEDIDWGTKRVFRQLLAKAEALSLSYKVLEKKSDIDNVGDFLKFKSAFESFQNEPNHVFETKS